MRILRYHLVTVVTKCTCYHFLLIFFEKVVSKDHCFGFHCVLPSVCQEINCVLKKERKFGCFVFKD